MFRSRGGTVDHLILMCTTVLLVVSETQNKHLRVAENIVFKIEVDEEYDSFYFFFFL